MKKVIILCILFCLYIFSCSREEDNLLNLQKSTEKERTRSIGDEEEEEDDPIIFDTLPNPYSIEVMQAVYDQYEGLTELDPTDLYVRFLPHDSLQLNILKYDYELELFDYPLDLDIPDGIEYTDPTVQEGEFTWLYTTVKPDFEFPSGIQYEILEECYIPEDDEFIEGTRVGESVLVEDMAFKMLGYEIDETTEETRGSKRRPAGVMRVYDDDKGTYVPLKGVKIRCHTLVKWTTAFTDENGSYSMTRRFSRSPRYAVVFDNVKGFDIWGNWGPIARANYKMGKHGNGGYSEDIGKGQYSWVWAIVNNAGYEYYKMCECTGISKPPSNIKIWVWKGFDSSSAAMLHRLSLPVTINRINFTKNFYLAFYGAPIVVDLIGLRKILPDITIGTQNKTSGKIYGDVFHELSHSSHFSKVGSVFWSRYVQYIVEYGAYGDGTGLHAELCAVGEMWGFFMGYINEYEKYASSIPERYPKDYYWFHPGAFWTLYVNNVLTKKQIFDCLVPGVETIDKLVEKMYDLYPTKADAIESAFVDNSITPGVPKPIVPGVITYDTFFEGKTVSSNTFFNGNNIYSKNVTVTNGAKLTLTGSSSVTLDAPFVVDAGSKMDMIRTNN